MTTKVQVLTILTLVSSLALAGAQALPAAKTGPAAGAEPGAVETLLNDIKKPVSWLTLGGDLRVRNEFIDNAVSLRPDDNPATATVEGVRHQQDVIRFRGRVWGTANLTTNLSLNARLSAEPREWMKPAFVGAYLGRQGMEWRYGILDVLNVRIDNLFGTPLSLTAGRQDIALGDYYDWWLVLDGTPGDGSWSFYLDSVRLSLDVKDIKTKFDLVYIYQNPEPGEWVPTLGNSSGYTITDQREQGVILYASNKSLKNTQLDGYFIYKRDDRLSTIRSGDNADIYTIGGKLTGTPAEHWLYSIEGAYQFGRKEDTISGVPAERDIAAYGGKAKLTYAFNDSLKNQVSLVGEFLSGDDPSTDKDEMFDLLWGRWPRWSELYIFSYINETGRRVAQINNLGRVGASWAITPVKNTTFTAMYNALLAPEATATRNVLPGAFSNDGNFRGHYLQTILKYQFNKHINAHLWGEWIWQGDFYARRDLLSFLRAEVMLSF